MTSVAKEAAPISTLSVNPGPTRTYNVKGWNGRFRAAHAAYRWLTRSPARWLSATFLLALSIRLIVVSAGYRDVAYGSSDFNLFGWEMGWTARSIVLGHGFSSPFQQLTGPTALVPPLYPYLLAAIFKLFGLYTAKAAFVTLSLNSLFSSLACLPIYFFTRNSLDTRAARIVSLAWAIYPFAVYFSAGRVWDYALTSLLFCCCLLVGQKLHLRGPVAWLGFGLLYGLTALSNPSIVSMLPVLLLIAIYKVHRVGRTLVHQGPDRLHRLSGGLRSLGSSFRARHACALLPPRWLLA